MLKKLMLVLSMFSLAGYGAVALSNVKVQQRYPWNGKVDISFDLTSTRNSNAVRITALDTSTGKDLNVRMVYDEKGNQLVAPFKMAPGSHRIVWDADKDVEGGFNNHVALSLSAGPYSERPLYMVVDLSGGVDAVDFPVEYLDVVPEGGWTREHKTTKLVLRLIQPGTFMMGPGPDATDIDGMGRETLHQVTLTKPFYIGVFRVSQKQWLNVMGSLPYDYKDKDGNMFFGRDEFDTYSVAYVSYGQIRGNNKRWPIRMIEGDSFLYRLRKKTGINNFDLPSEAQWEYACRAGTSSEDIYGFPNPGGNDYVLSYSDSNSNNYKYADVENWLPNAWGLYGFLKGYYVELVGDHWSWNLGTDPVIDPVGPITADEVFVIRANRSRPPHSRLQVGINNQAMDSPISFRVAVHLD